ncbi:MAG: M20/M25/M40 family metallo-hydrolase, partial [Thermoanaerobaculia bacterium]|nr:M20/M25/M40 family metallo-hydrolase [Thermoanaerobaculia bacterium]
MPSFVRTLTTLSLAALVLASFAADRSVAEQPPTKRRVLAEIDSQEEQLVELSDRIWRFAETALEEHRSAAALADYAEAEGFVVERGVAGMPTAFVASYGEGRPVIGILGEYDALPGISQKAQSTKAALEPGAAGHGCGHNLFGAASLGAATAVKELIASGELEGTIRFYGTPAEEAVGGKLYMIRDGLFDDLD